MTGQEQQSGPVRRPLHWEWDGPMIVEAAAQNPAWGVRACPLCGSDMDTHVRLTHEPSYNDAGQIDGLTVVACDREQELIEPEPIPQVPRALAIGKLPPAGFDMRTTDNYRPGMVLIALNDRRTREDVYSHLFDRDDVAGQQFHMGNAIAALHGEESVWDDQRITAAGELNPSWLEEPCRVCGQGMHHHDRLVLRVAYWEDRPGVLRDALVIACGPGAVIPEPIPGPSIEAWA